jgi:uncharacterized protein (DUF305 family)
MFRNALAVVAVLALATALALTGCSSSDSPAAPAAPPPVGPADITFASQTLPHHQQALDMASIAAERSASERVKVLAARITEAQEPEIARLSSMLESWGQPAPEDPGLHTAENAGLSGMLTEQDMAALESAPAHGFDRMFLDLMIRHHQGAVDMANRELATGVNPQARQFAEHIVASQGAEITELRSLVP